MMPPDLRSLMHVATRSLTAFGLLLALMVALQAQPAAIDAPCAQISAACEQAGFIYGRFKSGRGLELHCIRPIMAGMPQPPKPRRRCHRLTRRL